MVAALSIYCSTVALNKVYTVGIARKSKDKCFWSAGEKKVENNWLGQEGDVHIKK